MHLWTEYEGRTIAGAYTLGRLLRSEGRNGFFTTSDKTGHTAVIRLTEAHFDEDEQLRRWSQVAEVHQDNLIEIEQVGKTTFEGVPLTYALMEPDDANLGDVLKERPLTGAEAMQVAKSVVAALMALHNNGLVHEHVEPSNVLAVGEIVKLRSDCVRECVADIEFNTPEGCAELRKRDIHDLGVLLFQCLTLEKEWNPALNLPEPFNRVIPRALDGSWTLQQIGAFLDPVAFSAKPAGSAAPSALAAVPSAGTATNGAGATGAPELGKAPVQAAPFVAAQARPEPAIPVRAQRVMELPDSGSGLSVNKIWAVCITSAIVIALLAWHFLGSKPAQPAPAMTAAPSAAAPQQTAVAPAPVVTPPAAPAAHPVAPAPVAENAPAAPAAAHGHGWYVIAYTYNHEGQAAAKAERVSRRSGIHAEVFSPTGRAPYFVALGGAMSEGEANSVLRRARHAGLARDTFIRRY